MLLSTCKYLLIACFAMTAGLPFLAAPDTCRLNVKNVGTDEVPIYDFDCAGTCAVSGPCAEDSTTGGGTTVWFCECNGNTVTTKCAGRVSLYQGTYTPICVRNNCSNSCFPPIVFPVPVAELPANVCMCPDVGS